MRPDEMLRQDHEKVRSLFQQFEQGSGDKSSVAMEIVRELTVHAQLEEQLYYPEMRKLEGLTDKIEEGLREHQQVKDLLQQIESLTGPDQEKLVQTLKQDVEHHAQEEEREILPRTQELPAAEELGQRMEETKQQLSSRV